MTTSTARTDIQSDGLGFDDLCFDDLFMRSLPGDDGPPTTPRQVYRAHWSTARATPVPAPTVAIWVPEVATLLGWPSTLNTSSNTFAELLSGNRIAPGSRPFAMAYGGHQFGHWAGQLGDGRAMTLGEVVHAGQRWEVQLKGAGRTPYSRQGDGRAVLRSSIRELLCSEAMHHLGVPTTRALALTLTGDSVMRDMFYDGHPAREPGAIVTRVAPTFVRLGNFELFASRDDISNIELLLNWVIRVHYPDISGSPPANTPEAALVPTSKDQRAAFFVELCRRTATTIAHWMAVGFVHGVMNTDNLSILGLTIDYGPYGWLDHYDPAFTPNTTDYSHRRYAYARQAGVGLWNLTRLGESLLSVLTEADLELGLETYRTTVQATWSGLMSKKLGLDTPDDELFGDLLGLMARVETDWTLFFRSLPDVTSGVSPTDLALADRDPLRALAQVFYAVPSHEVRVDFEGWLSRLAARVAAEGRDPELRRASMNAVNPWFIPRNYLVHQAISEATNGDFTAVQRLLEAARSPFSEVTKDPALAGKRPEWARHQPGASALSCSS